MLVLHYPDVRDAVEWLTTALSFVERFRIGDRRCQLVYGNGRGSARAGRTEDHEYGERQCSFIDTWGRPWTLSETIFDSDPASFGGELLIE